MTFVYELRRDHYDDPRPDVVAVYSNPEAAEAHGEAEFMGRYGEDGYELRWKWVRSGVIVLMCTEDGEEIETDYHVVQVLIPDTY